MIDPAFVTRAVTVLQSGNIMQSRFTVYESHLSYILQFMCDFGLYGCGWIDLNEVWQRGQGDEGDEEGNSGGLIYKISPHFRESRMTLEVDVAAHQILNRHKLQARDLHHKPSVSETTRPSEPLIISVRELWEDERLRRIGRGLSPSPEIPVDPSESSRGSGGEWIAEARWWEEIQKRIQAERTDEASAGAVEQNWERQVISTFDSVQALWERDRRTRRPKRPRDPTQTAVDPIQNDSANTKEEPVDDWDQVESDSLDVTADVDEKMLSSQELSQMVEREEQQWAQLMGEGRAFEQEGAEEDYYDEEDDDILLPEDGPPPDLRDDGPTDSNGLPSADRGRCLFWTLDMFSLLTLLVAAMRIHFSINHVKRA